MREGLDLPEVSLVAILDADKEGFLRSERSLIQTIGRAARNEQGRVILYADKITESIRRAISETDRRRAIQRAYNVEHGITPKSTIRAIKKWEAMSDSEEMANIAHLEADLKKQANLDLSSFKNLKEIRQAMTKLHDRMLAHAQAREFEDAAKLRDQLKILKQLELQLIQDQAAQ